MNGLAKKRTWIGVMLFIPLAVVLLVTFACLPAPVGDPETASVDGKLTGAWRLIPDAGSDDRGLVIVRPWDKHTYFLQYLPMKKQDNVESARSVNYKAWLTEIGGVTFITCEALDTKGFMAEGMDADQYYWVAKLEVKDDTVTVTQLKDDAGPLKDLKTQPEIEAALKANVSNADIYDKATTFKKLSKDELVQVDEVRKLAQVGLDSGK